MSGGRGRAFAAGLAAGAAIGVAASAMAAGNPYAGLDTFARVLSHVQSWYVEPTDQETLVHRALEGMIASLDPHSRFLDPAAYRRVREDAAGEYVGIGATTASEPCGFRVVGLVPGGPAERAGVVLGDCIVAIDETRLAGLGVDAASERVRGREGEAAVLVLARGAEELRIPVLRARVVEPSTEVGMVPPGVAYLRLHSFGDHAAEELAAGVRGLGAVRAAVLDLRGNPGGRIDEAVRVADLFLGEGPAMSTRGRADGAKTYTTRDDAGDWTWPLAVLVDGGSASSTEILAGVLRDRGRAKLVGAPTFGKGSVQSIFGFEDGSALKLTVSRYTLPAGEAIADGQGLRPDVEVAGGAPELARLPLAERARRDPQLARALADVAAPGGG